MSGGVDSSVAAFLLKKQGYECIGCTMKLYDNKDIGISKGHTCCSLSDVEDARTINPAAAIGMDGEIGSIRKGKRANFTVLNEALNLRLVVVRGKVAYEAPPVGAVSVGD